MTRATIAGAPDPDRVAEDEDPAHDRREVGGNRSERDDSYTRTQLKPASRGVEGQDRGAQRDHCPLADDPLQADVDGPGEVLQCYVGHPEQHTGGNTEHEALGGGSDAVARCDPYQRDTERKDATLHGDQRGERVMTQRAGVRSPGDRDHGEPSRRDDHSGPLPASKLKAEVALGEHREEDQPAREHGLHDRQRRERERAYMEPPRCNRHRPPQRERTTAEQARSAAQRMTGPHGRCQYRPALLEEEPDIRTNR